MMLFLYPRYSLANSSYMVALPILFHFCISGIFLPFLHFRSSGIFLSVCLLHFRSLENVGTDLRCFLYPRSRFPLISAVFHKRRYKNDVFSVPTLFSRQLLLYGGINHTVSLLCSLENVGTDLRSFLYRRTRFPLISAVFHKRRYKNDALSVPTLFSCQLFLSGGINHTVSLLYFGNLPAFSALSFFGNLPVSLPSALSFFGKRRYKNDAFSVPTLFQCTHPSLWSCFPCRSVAPSSCLAALIHPCCRTVLEKR